jgi:hypothetical protein
MSIDSRERDALETDAEELPRRFAGQLDLPPPQHPVWFETDLDRLRRVRNGLLNLSTDSER